MTTQQITHHLERLKAANILAPGPAELRKLVAQQLRSEVAAAVAMNLVSEEIDQAYLDEKQHLRLEKRLTKLKPTTTQSTKK